MSAKKLVFFTHLYITYTLKIKNNDEGTNIEE